MRCGSSPASTSLATSGSRKPSSRSSRAAYRAPARASRRSPRRRGSRLSDPIASASTAVQPARDDRDTRTSQTQAALAVDAYKPIVKLSPNDPNIQLELAQAAQQAGDAATAIAAYTAFLKLAPDDPNAAIVKQQLKQLRETSAASG